MLEKLSAFAERRAAKTVARKIDLLAHSATPPGVTAIPVDNGIALAGKHLRRMLNDPSLRNFGR